MILHIMEVRQVNNSMNILLLPESIREKLGEKATEDFVGFLNHFSQQNKENILGRMEALVSEAKADIIKWMFVFWVSQLAFVFGLVTYIK